MIHTDDSEVVWFVICRPISVSVVQYTVNSGCHHRSHGCTMANHQMFLVFLIVCSLLWCPLVVECEASEEHYPLPRTESFDLYLVQTFPGVFFTDDEVKKIDDNISESRRCRRSAVDDDMCCKTKLWFGTAPDQAVDVDGTEWVILKGDTMHQAYSRGDCDDTNPQPSCPAGGHCRQITRLQMLWVEDDGEAIIKYFAVNSHCAYESMLAADISMPRASPLRSAADGADGPEEDHEMKSTEEDKTDLPDLRHVVLSREEEL